MRKAITNWFFHAKSSLFLRKSTHSLRLTCHSTCPLPQRILLSKRTSRLYESLQNTCAALISREQSDFANFGVSSCQEQQIFHEISSSGTCLWIELRFCMRKTMTSKTGGKILPAKTIRFFNEKSSLFFPKTTHSLHFTCHSTCPLPQRVLPSKRTSRLFESHQNTCAAPILREQSDFANFEVSSCQEKPIFHEISSSVTCNGATT